MMMTMLENDDSNDVLHRFLLMNVYQLEGSLQKHDLTHFLGPSHPAKTEKKKYL